MYVQYRYLVLIQTAPSPQPWRSKIVAGNKDNEQTDRAGGLGCLDQDQISILFVNKVQILFCIYENIFARRLLCSRWTTSTC